MEVRRAATAGFCMGVSLALHKLDTAIRKNGMDGAPVSRICTCGPIIHNPQVLGSYAAKGVACLKSPSEASCGDTVVIRAHGITTDEEATLHACGATVIDATCPRVKSAQVSIRKAIEEGGCEGLLLFGDADHPEVRGLISYCPAPSRVFASAAEILDDMPDAKKKWVLASQTTQDATIFRNIRRALEEHCPDITVLSTICDATGERQAEARRIATDVDAMVVVGGRSSGNTRRLAELAAEAGIPTYHVEVIEELSPNALQGLRSVGLTAGASTPKALIDGAEEWLRAL